MPAFVHRNIVRMYDTDAAGILYFASQFRFVHDAFEHVLETEGFSFKDFFTKTEYLFVIVHAESDYKKSLVLSDVVDIHTYVKRIGETSFTMGYDIYRDDELVGSATTIHVCIDKINRKKRELPEKILGILNKYSL